MTKAHRTSPRAALVGALVALLAAGACGATASGAAAASAADPAAGGGTSVIGSAAGPPGAPAPAAPSPSNVIIVGQAPSGPAAAPAAAPPAGGGPVRDAPAVLAAGASAAPVGRPSAPAAPRGPFDTQIITNVGHRPPASSPRPAVAQLDSGGPLVGYAGGPGAPVTKLVAHLPASSAAGPGAVAALSGGLPLFAAPPAAAPRALSVSVAMEGVYLSASTIARRPGQRSPAVAAPLIGPAGLGSVSLDSPWGGSGSRVPGGSAWLGGAPVSSSGASGVSLSGLTAVLAAMMLLAGVSWRRPWLWPQAGLSSLLAASALDRPG